MGRAGDNQDTWEVGSLEQGTVGMVSARTVHHSVLKEQQSALEVRM
jgi:hypothetical protein